jgi:F0F1-type ATP synthase membrane subunit b/b'
VTTGELLQDVVAIFAILTVVVGVAGWVARKLNKSRQREIDDRIAAAEKRRAKEQQDTPVEKELRARIGELKQSLADQGDQHRQEIAALRTEHDREITDIRRTFTAELDTLRAQLTEAYRTRPNAAGGTA